jgi:hypothetical protein
MHIKVAKKWEMGLEIRSKMGKTSKNPTIP